MFKNFFLFALTLLTLLLLTGCVSLKLKDFPGMEYIPRNPIRIVVRSETYDGKGGFKIAGEYEIKQDRIQEITGKILNLKFKPLEDPRKRISPLHTVIFYKSEEEKILVELGFLRLNDVWYEPDKLDAVIQLLDEAKVDINLNIGIYKNHEETVTIELFEDNSFRLEIINLSYHSTGTYHFERGKLVLPYSENQDLFFQIEEFHLIFIGSRIDGTFVEDGPMPIGYYITFYKK